MKTMVCILALALPFNALARSSDSQAALKDIEKTLGFVPGFLRALPDSALPGAWQEMKEFEMSPETALSPKVKELIGLAVAAQIPCHYCIAAHTEFAKMNGASPEDLGLAIAEAGLTRHWSAFINGIPLDDRPFRQDLNKMIERLKERQGTAYEPVAITDSDAAYAEMEKRIGFVPNFMKLFPKSGIAGAWLELRDVEMTPHDLQAKYVSLMGLAVGSQIPCRYCVDADTELARSQGATDDEIAETVAMAAHTRNFSSLLNGVQLDETAFKTDLHKLANRRLKTAQK